MSEIKMCPVCGKNNWRCIHFDCVGGSMDVLTCLYCNYKETYDRTELNEDAIWKLINPRGSAKATSPKKWRAGMKQCNDCGRIYPSKTYVKCPDCLSLKYEDYRGSASRTNK